MTMTSPRRTAPTAEVSRRASPRALVGRAARHPALGGLLLLIAAIVTGVQLSPSFWQPHFLLFDTGLYVEFGMLALPMTLLIVMGEIDLSVGSMVGLSGAVFADLYGHGLPIAVSAVACLLVGVVLGLVNGLLVTTLSLPSLVVTLATMSGYRGIAQVILGSRSIVMPDGFTGFDQRGFTGSAVDLPAELAVFLLVAGGFAFLLHHTVFGQLALTIGANRDAARFSGVRVDRARLVGFLVSGAMSGVVALLYATRSGSMDYRAGTGYELLAIAVVVLGGANIFGGRGSMVCTVIAFFTVVAIREAMSVRGVNQSGQEAVIGAVLVASILLPNLYRPVRRRVSGRRTRSGLRYTSPTSIEGD